MESPAVAFDQVTHRYGSKVALDALTFHADPARITCVLGPNGAGKTTAMELAEGLKRPQDGLVRVLGTNPWRSDAAHRAAVGVMLQDGGPPGAVPAKRFLTHVTGLVGGTRLEELAERLDLPSFWNTPVRRLSGGQRQRVALAAALIGSPDVAFLDEPTAGLDPHARLEVWDLIRDERARGCAVVVTTHSFEEAERLADDVVVIAAGAVRASGTLTDVAGTSGLEETYFALTSRSGATR
ncbi:ABC transporter ATP-binding protein [Yimella sp. cx-51]|uniref:ABC transporter ATP-binding protein n=1 Tax=Yimella sp. cx-51 TaxID=2770551 RepID=UPI00165E3AD6|nr:ABC transporter ATP-binding protein [Yimella sp. cx-51]MBC9957416.1 ABC transporter ATP-binding protein [Yimella sp. cx-51]QTH39344.1 ABC transporter ATP-binding protein [Yimella sp. cx-51]